MIRLMISVIGPIVVGIDVLLIIEMVLKIILMISLMISLCNVDDIPVLLMI